MLTSVQSTNDINRCCCSAASLRIFSHIMVQKRILRSLPRLKKCLGNCDHYLFQRSPLVQVRQMSQSPGEGNKHLQKPNVPICNLFVSIFKTWRALIHGVRKCSRRRITGWKTWILRTNIYYKEWSFVCGFCNLFVPEYKCNFLMPSKMLPNSK